MNYLMLPGNPPAVYFYEEWGREIRARQAGARVRVSAYPLIGPTHDSSKAMEEIARVHAQQMKDFAEEVEGPVTLIGHSLGAYFALKLLERHPTRVERAMLLFPFLRAPGSRGRLILDTFRPFHERSYLRAPLLRSRRFLELFFKDLAHVTDEELDKTLHLVAHESMTVGRDDTQLLIPHELRPKVRVFHATRDTWCPPSVVRQLREQVVAVECGEPHDFVTKPHYRQNLFDRISESSR